MFNKRNGVKKIENENIKKSSNRQVYTFLFKGIKFIFEGGNKNFLKYFVQLFRDNFIQEEIRPDNLGEILKKTSQKMNNIIDEIDISNELYPFSILVCFELEDGWMVGSCGDGYVIEEKENYITFARIDNSENIYYLPAFLTDNPYKEKVLGWALYRKNEFENIGIASSGVENFKNLSTEKQHEFFQILKEKNENTTQNLKKFIDDNLEFLNDDINILL